MQRDRVQGTWARRGTGFVMGLLAAAVSLPALAARTTTTCHAPEETVSVRGHVVSEAYAGPPNYASIRRGDAREVQPVLRLSKPLCVDIPGVDGRTLRLHVRRLHVVDVRSRLTSSRRARCGQGCILQGRLMEAESGHHHTRILLEIE